MRFSYSGLIYGRSTEGFLDAEGVVAARKALKEKGISVIRLEEEKASQYSGSPGKVKIKLASTLELSKKMEVMINAGLPFSKIFQMLVDQAGEKEKSFVIDLKARVEQGESLSEVFSDYPDSFDPVFVSLIRAGEVSGKLGLFVGRAREYLEARLLTRKKIKKALGYPITLAVVASAVVAIMLVYVVPVFAEIFAQSGSQLPNATRIVLSTSETLQDFHFVATVGALLTMGVFFAKRFYLARGRFRRFVDRLMLRMPLASGVTRAANIYTLCSINSNLSAGGVSIVDGLDITVKAVRNIHYQEAMANVREKIVSGVPVAEAFLTYPALFPDTFIALLEVGEQTGSLGKMLKSAESVYRKEMEDKISAQLTVIEPLLISVMGLIIGFILIAMYAPMFSLGSAL